jgi:galactitol-specific phosphotransferase system IIB component
MYKMHSSNFKTSKIKNMRKHRNKKELREEFTKHQSLKKDTIERDLWLTTKNIKEELNKDMEKRIKQKSWK